MFRLPCTLIRLAFLLFLTAAASAADRGDTIGRERAKVEGEIAAARAAHPAFDEYLDRTIAHITQHPSLSIEQAYCIVVRGVLDEPGCRESLAKLALSLALPLIPPGGVPVLRDAGDGIYQVMVDEAGLPVFEHPGPPTSGGGAAAPRMIFRLRETYGPGIYQDATGRPFSFVTQEGERAYGPIKLHGYGPGVHMDQYGRAVSAIPQH